MAFIRRKRTSAGAVYQVVRSERAGALVRQVVLTSLGRYATLGDALASERRGLAAIEQLPGHSAWTEATAAQHRARIAQLEAVQAQTRLA